MLKKRKFTEKMSLTAKTLPLTAEVLEKDLACVSLKTQVKSFLIGGEKDVVSGNKSMGMVAGIIWVLG